VLEVVTLPECIAWIEVMGVGQPRANGFKILNNCPKEWGFVPVGGWGEASAGFGVVGKTNASSADASPVHIKMIPCK
jgi:hypothetical protein